MRKFLIIFLIFALLLPVFASAQDAAKESFLRAKIRLLQLQVELLTAQISLLLRGVQPALVQVNCAQVQISWERVSGADSYRLYRDGLLVYEGTSREFVDSKLTPGKKYRYSVYGVARGAQGLASEIKEITAPSSCPPATPLLRLGAEPCGGNITLSWSRPSGASTYQVFRSNREIYQGPLPGFVDSSLRPGQTYEYKIRAGNVGGWSGFSATQSFGASVLCAPSAPEVSQVIPQAHKEGMLLVEMRSSPGNNTKVRLRRDGKTLAIIPSITSVMAFEAKARLSDVTVTRVDLFFDERPWLWLDKVELRFGGRTIAEKQITQESFSRLGSERIYQLRFAGLNAFVREGRSGTFTVRVKTKEFIAGRLPHNITVFLENNSIRGVDKAGIWHIAPVSGGGKGGVFSRTFKVE